MKLKDKLRGQKQEERIPTPEPDGMSQKMGYFLKRIEQRVAGQLDAQTIKISNTKIPFVGPVKDETKDFNRRLKQVQNSKVRMHSRLREVAEEEKQLISQQRIHNLNQSRLKSMSPAGTKTKSELSEQDVNLLKRLRKEQKRFEKSLEQKSREYEERLKQTKKQEQEALQKQKREEIEVRRKQIVAKMQQSQKHKQQKSKRLQQQKHRLTQLKAKKKFHEQISKKQKDSDRIQLESRVSAMQERLKQRQIDLQAIKEHEEKYKELKVQQQVQRDKRKQDLDEMAKQKRLNVQKSKYYTLVVTQGRKRKEEVENKERERLNLVSAAREYAENIKRQHAPRIKTHSSEQNKSKEKLEGLTFQEVKTVGNNYLQFMKRLPKKKPIKGGESDLGSSSSKKTPLRTLSTKYRDYLSERRHLGDKMSRTRESRVRGGMRGGVWKEVQDACKMADTDKRQEGLQRMKLLANRLQVERGNDDHQMLDKISAKLKILETLAKR